MFWFLLGAIVVLAMMPDRPVHRQRESRRFDPMDIIGICDVWIDLDKKPRRVPLTREEIFAWSTEANTVSDLEVAFHSGIKPGGEWFHDPRSRRWVRDSSGNCAGNE